MFKNYILTSVRQIKRQKVHATINIFGLAIGMACSLLILIWVQDEFSYDSFHKNKDRIYRLTPELEGFEQLAVTPAPLGKAVEQMYREVESYVRTFESGNIVFKYNDVKSKEQYCIFTDSTFFDIFSFRFIKGNRDDCLRNPYGIVITETIARKYFGDCNVIGKKIKCENRFELTVEGVIENIPPNSNFRFNIVMPFALLVNEFGVEDDAWHVYDYMTFVLMDESFKYTDDYPIQYFYQDNDPNETKNKLLLQALSDIHLHSECNVDFKRNRNAEYVYLFLLIAFFILLIACINFINLTTAKSLKRSREVGIRKVNGATRIDLIKQFYGEAFSYAFVALIIAIGLVELFVPVFNQISGKNIDIHHFGNLYIYVFFIVVLLVTTLISGSYPALLLSSFRPSVALKMNLRKTKSKGAFFRRFLVVFQFATASVLIVTSLIINQQIMYIADRDLGYNDRNLIKIGIEGKIAENIQKFKEELIAHKNIHSVSATETFPLYMTSSTSWTTKDSVLRMHFTAVDEDFIHTFGLSLLEGENFDTDDSIKQNGFIINQSAIEAAGFDDAIIGRELTLGNDTGVIIGVINDYHFRNLKDSIAPMLLKYTAENYQHLFIYADDDKISEVKTYIRKKWNNIESDIPVVIKYYGEVFDETYEQELKTAQTFRYFSILAIIISCLGLFGLSQFLTEQRIKEIGVRKVMGATVTEIVRLLSVEYIKWVAMAMGISFPVAYFLSVWWLNRFAYHTDIHIYNFVITAIAIFVIALSTVFYQVIKTAANNPVDALRNE